jgi:sulfur relay (sulfurtransferase) complex TusBCD TusD component (DsrE family)
MLKLFTKDPVRRGVVDEDRAAVLLGLPESQLREICELSGLGHLEEGTTTQQLVFTYEELHRLCRLIVGPTS